MISGHTYRRNGLGAQDENGNVPCGQCGQPVQAHAGRKTAVDGPLVGVHEHRPELVDGRMACKLCGQRIRSLRFGVWLIWVSLEPGQVCTGETQ